MSWQPTACVLSTAVSVMLLGSLAGCGQPAASQRPAATTAEEDADFVRMATAGRMLSDLQDFLNSKEPAPKVFTFDRLDFRPGSASVRPVDEKTIYALANALQEHPGTRIRIVGYDDGSGTRDANATLARQRAAAVVIALRQIGVSSSRLEASSGHEGHGARSTELVVLQK
jgi:outer membrane protein OmpA-like peptidoglycan-associated protein